MGPSGKKKIGEEDRSDLFSLGQPANTIPPIREVPETPEERKRRRTIRMVSAAVAAVTLIVALIISIHLYHRASVRSAALAAGDAGRTALLIEALDVLEGDDGDEDRALRARLRASGALEHARPDDADVARKLLEELGEGGQTLLNARVAATYLALLATDPPTAQRTAATVLVKGTYAAEGAYAVARAMFAGGDMAQALQFAALAAERRPEAPRYGAMHGLVLARAEGVEAATKALDALPEEARGSPAVRLARARILFEPRGSADAGLGHARAILEAEGATPPEHAWARLLLARSAAETGDGAGALQHVEQALPQRPPADEPFTLLLVETLLAAGAVSRAAEHYDSLPEVSTDAARRAQVGGELALDQGQLAVAHERLAAAKAAPWTTLLQARLAEARGKYERAETLYREAAQDPNLLGEAFTRLGAMLLTQDRPADALELLAKVLESTPHDPDAVPVAVRAHVALGRPEEGARLVQAALGTHSGDARLLTARAHVEMATERWSEALETLRAAAKKQPGDPDVHANLGEAARQVGRDDEARTAYEKALEAQPAHPTALVGLFELSVDEEKVDEAQGLLARIDGADLVSTRVDRARAALFVMTGVGSDGVGTVRRSIIRRGSDDPVLWLALGRLQLQAERYGSAVAAFGRALKNDPDNPDALLGRATGQIRLRRAAPAEQTLEDVRKAMRERGTSDVVRARLKVAEGRLRYLDDLWGASARLAREALELDPRCSEAHLLLADVAEERNQDSTPHLRKVLEGRNPLPEARARLALALGTGDEACAEARKYRDVAPSGRLRRSTYRLLRGCR